MSNTPSLPFLRMPSAEIPPALPLPKRASPQSAGLDLQAALDAPISLHPGQRTLVPCGFALQIPENHVGFVCPRSGLALKFGLTVLNAPGIIDSDYRGEIQVILQNLGSDTVQITRGQRIAQLLILPCSLPLPCETNELDQTSRSSSGFGSSGL